MKRWIAGSHEQLHKWWKFIIHCNFEEQSEKVTRKVDQTNANQQWKATSYKTSVIRWWVRGGAIKAKANITCSIWECKVLVNILSFVSAKLRRYRKRVKPLIVQCGSWTKEQLSVIVESRCRYITLKKGRYHDVDFSEETPDISWFIDSFVINST
jgi:hypothetical protein